MMMMMMMIVYRVEGEGKRQEAKGGEGGEYADARTKRESRNPRIPPPVFPSQYRFLPRYARTIRRNLQLAPFVGKL